MSQNIFDIEKNTFKKKKKRTIFLAIPFLFQHFSRNISYKNPGSGRGTKEDTHWRQADSGSNIHPCVGTSEES